MPPRNSEITQQTSESEEPHIVEATLLLDRSEFRSARHIKVTMYEISELPEFEALRHTQVDTSLYLGRKNESEGVGTLYIDEKYDSLARFLGFSHEKTVVVAIVLALRV